MRVLALCTLVACGPGGNNDAGVLDATLHFTGELVDWDSNEASFCGVFDATFTVRGDAARTDRTSPNGRFELDIVSAPTTILDISPPAAPSQCITGTYAIPGAIVASRQVIESGVLISARMFTAARAAAFGFDAAKAHVFVHLEGAPRAVDLTGTHAPAQAFDGNAWAAGATGANVYFPNVDPAPGTAAVSVAGGALGTGDVPLTAGSFTYVTVVTNVK